MILNEIRTIKCLELDKNHIASAVILKILESFLWRKKFWSAKESNGKVAELIFIRAMPFGDKFDVGKGKIFRLARGLVIGPVSLLTHTILETNFRGNGQNLRSWATYAIVNKSTSFAQPVVSSKLMTILAEVL